MIPLSPPPPILRYGIEPPRPLTRAHLLTALLLLLAAATIPAAWLVRELVRP